MTTRILLAVVTACLVCWGSAASARPKTDIITMLNGDRVQAEILSMDAGLLEAKTDYMGTVSIQWEDVASIQSDYNFELRTSDGRRLYGLISPVKEGRVIALQDIYGDSQLPWLDVVELRPLEKTLKDALDIYLSAGVNYTKASDLKQGQFKTDISYETEYAINNFTARTTHTDTGENTTKATQIDLLRQQFVDKASHFYNYYTSYENNDELELRYRWTVGGGIGRYWLDTHRRQLQTAVALQVISEANIGEAETRSTEAALNLRYNGWRFNTPKLNLIYSLDLYPSLTQHGRLRANTDLTLSWEIIKDLTWEVSAWVTYDNDNPTDTRYDYAFTTGIGWTY